VAGGGSLTADIESVGVTSRTGTIVGTGTLTADAVSFSVVAAAGAIVAAAALTATVLRIVGRDATVTGQAVLVASFLERLSDKYRVGFTERTGPVFREHADIIWKERQP
jgi:hypothetical protein